MVTEKTFKVPIFGNKIKVVVFDDLSEIRDKYHIMGNPVGCTIEDIDKTIICIPRNDIYTVIHECVHATSNTLKYIGQEPSNTNDEFTAYLLTYIVDRVKAIVDKY